MIIKELPMEERPRERLLKYGAHRLSNEELLAILIRSGKAGRNAKQIAAELLALDGRGIAGLAGALPEELAVVDGIGPAKACEIAAAVELGKRLATRPVTARSYVSDADACAGLFMEELRDKKKEVFCLLLLTSRGGVIAKEVISVGDLNSSVVHPREVFQGAMKKSAMAVVLVHNHPSGDPTPSPEDKETTKRLAVAGQILGIRVLDHIIIGDGIWFSFRSSGLMEE